MLRALQKPYGAEGRGGFRWGLPVPQTSPSLLISLPGPPFPLQTIPGATLQSGEARGRCARAQLGHAAVPGCCREQGEGSGGQQVPAGASRYHQVC